MNTALAVQSLNAEQAEAFLAKLLACAKPTRPVLTNDEAAQFVGCKNERAFRRWRKRWQVSACSKGRYSTRALNAAMEREARA